MRQILGGLPADLAASVFVVLHLPARPAGHLVRLLTESGPMLVKWAEDQEQLRRGTVYLAPADRHLVLENQQVRVLFGARESLARPAIDVLFRSAAAAMASRVIGVLLSGKLDDGARGLAAIGRCGGVTIVLDPAVAEEPEMPRNALREAAVDHCLNPAAIAPLLLELTGQPVEPVTVPRDIAVESRIARESMSEEVFPEWDETASLACPECGGPLQVFGKGESLSFRCRVGHAFGTASLLAAQQNQLERALWIAIRTLTDRKRMLDRLVEDYRSRNRHELAKRMAERADELGQHYRLLRNALISLNPPDSGGAEAAV